LLGFDIRAFDVIHYSEYLKQFGIIFIDLIMMIVAPLIFFSLVSGVNTISDTNALGRVGMKAMGSYLFTSIFAISIGIWLGNVFEPGVGVDLSALEAAKSGEGSGGYELPQLMKIVLSIIPDNALGAMAGADGKANTLQTVFVAIFVGIALIVMGEQGKRVADFCHSSAQLMFKMIGFIIRLSPYAVWGLMAWVSATLGIEAIIQLGYLVLATITGMGIHYLFIIACVILLLRLKPWPFMAKSIEYQMIAFSTTSSKATLATSMEVAEKKLGVSKPITSFILPLGAAVNMDGTAIYLGIAAIFFAQAFGIELEMYHYGLIIFTSTIAAVGAAGYPGGSLVVMALVLETIGVPTSGIALLIGVDRILDMFRTTVNITSDVGITAFIDKTEGTFNKKIYYTPAHDLEEAEYNEDIQHLKAAETPGHKIGSVKAPVKKASASKAAKKSGAASKVSKVKSKTAAKAKSTAKPKTKPKKKS